MGFWGTQPKSNDQSHDLWDAAAALAVADLVRRCSKPARYSTQVVAGFERAGAVQLALEAGLSLPRALVENAVKDLDAILRDKWIESWRNPEKARHSIRSIRAAMKKLLDGRTYYGTLVVRRVKAGRRRGRPVKLRGVWSRRERGLQDVKAVKPKTILAPAGWPAKTARFRGAR